MDDLMEKTRAANAIRSKCSRKAEVKMFLKIFHPELSQVELDKAVSCVEG